MNMTIIFLNDRLRQSKYKEHIPLIFGVYVQKLSNRQGRKGKKNQQTTVTFVQ